VVPNPPLEPRSRPRRHRRWVVAWAARVALALVFALGMMSSTSRKLTEAEYEPVVEVGEDGEALAREGKSARVVRRHDAARRMGGWVWTVSRPRAPQRLDPTVPEPTPPRWLRPRRAPPPADDDGPSIG
jgi:hypothetical protein